MASDDVIKEAQSAPKVDYDIDRPKPQPVFHRFRLNERAVKDAILTYLDAQGYAVPPGNGFLLGLDRTLMGHREHCLIFTIEEPADAEIAAPPNKGC